MAKSKYFQTSPGFNHLLGWDMKRDLPSPPRKRITIADNQEYCGKHTHETISASQMTIDLDWMN